MNQISRKSKPGRKLTVSPRPGINPDQIYNRRESAAVIGCSWITLVRANLNGYLRGYRTGRTVKHTGRQLLDWLESGGHTGHTAAEKEAAA